MLALRSVRPHLVRQTRRAFSSGNALVTLEKDGGIATVTMNGPPVNSLSLEM